MLYLNDTDIKRLKPEWHQNIQVIKETVRCILENDYVQPIKPYLRYRDVKNRIIAMPAFVGGGVNMSGIKWIASFPNNIYNDLPRAHCVVILNDPDTGVPVGILNSGTISAVRTASVSGLILKCYLESRNVDKVNLGVIGFGPIGQNHLDMCSELLGDIISKVFLYDKKKIDVTKVPDSIKDKIVIVDSWEAAYSDADIFITCTASTDRYINQKPKPGSLHLNVSLRDYTADVFQWFSSAIVVDNWEEVCRENTDIEIFHREKKLQKKDTRTIEEVVFSDCFEKISEDQAILFNPMGMAVFDIAVAWAYLKRATNQAVGLNME